MKYSKTLKTVSLSIVLFFSQLSLSFASLHSPLGSLLSVESDIDGTPAAAPAAAAAAPPRAALQDASDVQPIPAPAIVPLPGIAPVRAPGAALDLTLLPASPQNGGLAPLAPTNANPGFAIVVLGPRAALEGQFGDDIKKFKRNVRGVAEMDWNSNVVYSGANALSKIVAAGYLVLNWKNIDTTSLSPSIITPEGPVLYVINGATLIRDGSFSQPFPLVIYRSIKNSDCVRSIRSISKLGTGLTSFLTSGTGILRNILGQNKVKEGFLYNFSKWGTIGVFTAKEIIALVDIIFSSKSIYQLGQVINRTQTTLDPPDAFAAEHLELYENLKNHIVKFLEKRRTHAIVGIVNNVISIMSVTAALDASTLQAVPFIPAVAIFLGTGGLNAGIGLAHRIQHFWGLRTERSILEDIGYEFLELTDDGRPEPIRQSAFRLMDAIGASAEGDRVQRFDAAMEKLSKDF